MSTEKNTPTNGRLMHVGTICPKGPKRVLLLLREQEDGSFAWFEEQEEGQEVSCDVKAPTIREALKCAWKQWKRVYFKPLNCGTRFTLPERDEIGRPAYFHEMVTSYNTMTGPYFEEKLGHQCTVLKPSIEALDLMRRLSIAHRL